MRSISGKAAPGSPIAAAAATRTPENVTSAARWPSTVG